MHTDPDLPYGWRRKVVKRKKMLDMYDVYIFSPCGIRFRSRKQLKGFLESKGSLLDIDRFSFSLTEDKNGPKTTLKKLIKCPNYKSPSPVSQNTTPIKDISKTLDKIFSFQSEDQGFVTNEVLKDVEKSQPVDVKNFVRREALRTLLSIGESEKDNDTNTESEERQLTELEELDLFYDFNYDKDKEEFDVRKVFDSDSDDEDNI